MPTLERFIRESNVIEGIIRPPTQVEIRETQHFLELDRIIVYDLELLVQIYQPGIRLRTKPGMDVYVGDHKPPPGGPGIMADLVDILSEANDGTHPHFVHHLYETLHPFMDGNGRTGRALWAWQMVRRPGIGLRRGFLHEWYYQSLQLHRIAT